MPILRLSFGSGLPTATNQAITLLELIRLRFIVLTLFPEVIHHYCQASIIGRGQQAGHITVETVNPRDFANDKHKHVDDTPYGGGAGMVMMAPPIIEAYESIQGLPANSPTLITTPAGQPFTQQTGQAFQQDYQAIVMVCGHYEGIDARVNQLLPNVMEVSLGDFVLTGGELPVLCMIDAISRHVAGVVQKRDSVTNDSFSGESAQLLEYPHYTRPAEYRGLGVPEVLRSGNHAAIADWRYQQSLSKTQAVRPDLLPS